ncbi:hypothetical protein B0T16DRAFT_318937, partial [Cercophora newfieldiana]
AEDVLLSTGIPAARRAGIQIIWLSWGITEDDLEALPPAVDRIFRFDMDEYHKSQELRDLTPDGPSPPVDVLFRERSKTRYSGTWLGRCGRTCTGWHIRTCGRPTCCRTRRHGGGDRL